MTTLLFVLVGLLFGVLLLKIRMSFREALLTGFQFYCLAWFIFGCLYCAVYIIKVALVLMLGFHNDWTSYMLSHKWIIQGIIYSVPVITLLASSLSNRPSNKNTTTYNSGTKHGIKPTIIPVPVSTTKKQISKSLVRPISRKNLTNLKNNLRDGINTSISLKEYCDSDISELTSYAGQCRTKLSLTDCYLISSIRQLANIARNGHGYVFVDSVIEAGSEAIDLASNGVCFTCDCKNRSTTIKSIVEKAKQSNGKVVLINCRNMSSNEISVLRSIGKDNIEIK